MKKKRKNYNKKTRKFISKSKKKKNLILKYSFLLFLVYIIFSGIKYLNNKQSEYINDTVTTLEEISDSKNEEISEYQLDGYNECLDKYYNSDDLTVNIMNKIEEVNDYLSQYKASVYYYDTTNGFSYKYNEDKVYYAASTIKMLDALYIYENAFNNNLNLDDTLTYTQSNKIGASKMMQNYKVGDSVSLRNLVKYAVMVSDNSAHDMLIDYIGFDNLKAFGNSLGAKYTLVGGDDFGSISVDDAIDYLVELNKFINNNGILGSELKDYFVNGEQNYLNFPELGIDAAEKYGEYEANYHENGIVYDSRPYLISILTTEGNNEDVIRGINSKILELHNLFYSERQDRCYSYIYED